MNNKFELLTMLKAAIKKNNFKEVKTILNTLGNIDYKNKQGDTALHIAAREGNNDMVLKLLYEEADPLTTNNRDETPLFIAAKNGYKDIIDTYADFNINIDHTNKRGNTALMVAARHSGFEVVRKLIEKGANVNHSGMYGNTPLHCAAYSNRYFNADILLLNGADPNIANGINELPLTVAIRNYVNDDEADPIMVEILLRGGIINGEGYDHNGGNHLHTAAFYGNPITIAPIREILECVLYSLDYNSNTPLHIAATYGHTDFVVALLREGALVNRININGYSPLDLAAKNGHTNVVGTLLKKGANVKATNNEGKTAEQIAYDSGHIKTSKLINHFTNNMWVAGVISTITPIIRKDITDNKGDVLAKEITLEAFRAVLNHAKKGSNKKLNKKKSTPPEVNKKLRR